MDDIDRLLKDYRQRGEASLKKEAGDYSSFKEMEADYCSLINEGNAIRKKILQTPDCCDVSTYRVLTNEVAGFTAGLRGKFKPLTMVFIFTQRLYDAYQKQLEEAEKSGNDEAIISLNEQLYNFTQKYIYRKNIADILYKKYKNFKQAMEIYEQIEPSVDDKDYEYWQNYAELNAEYEKYEKRDYCIHQAQLCKIKAEIKKNLDDKDYKAAIKKYENLFNITKDYTCKKEIANIYAVFFKDIKKAIKIYRSLEPELKSDAQYWYQLSSLYEYNENYYREVLCLKKAIDIELGEPETEAS